MFPLKTAELRTFAPVEPRDDALTTRKNGGCTAKTRAKSTFAPARILVFRDRQNTDGAKSL
jgi:hypothetical protein